MVMSDRSRHRRWLKKSDKVFVYMIVSLVLLTLAGFVAYDKFFMNSDLYTKAINLYKEGNRAKAIEYLSKYHNRVPDDSDAYRALGQWCAEDGDMDRAKRILESFAVIPEEDTPVVLSTLRKSKSITEIPSGVSLNISNNIIKNNNVKITVTSKNLFSGSYVEGNLYKSNSAYRTTEWFPVDSSRDALVMSGGFNRASWQFLTDTGRFEYVLSADRYRRNNTNAVANRLTSVVEIPENAIAGRVFYADTGDTETATLDERLQIEYGRFPSDYQEYYQHTYTFTNMNVGETVTYTDGVWSVEPVEKTEFKLAKGDTITMEADVSPVCKVNYHSEAVVTDGIYGVSWKVDDPTILLERTDDAVGLSFNYLGPDGMVGIYENDFDSIYPWSEIRLCAVDNDGKVTYADDADFTTDGRVGNVFVEIPKHYVKREVTDGREYIAISGTPREGFVLDPSFETAGGVEHDHIYIAAYLTSVRDGRAYSNSGEIPENCMSLREVRECIAPLGESYGEIDICALLTLQRLFLVETAIRNTTVLWDGVSYRAYFQMNPETSAQYATQTKSASNEITVISNKSTDRFRVGMAVAVVNYDQWQGQTRNDPAYNRVIVDIVDSGDEKRICFDSDPIDIVAGVTQITCVPAVNGETDSLGYHSGILGKNDGLTSFRYRYIENLWANAFVYVDGITVHDSALTFTLPNGTGDTLSYALPVQAQHVAHGEDMDYSSTSISAMGFDERYPLVAMPSRLDTSTASYYGDTLYTSYNEYWREKTYTFLYGGTWDLRQSTGLFSYRCIATLDSHHRENSSRMAYRP